MYPLIEVLTIACEEVACVGAKGEQAHPDLGVRFVEVRFSDGHLAVTLKYIICKRHGALLSL